MRIKTLSPFRWLALGAAAAATTACAAPPGPGVAPPPRLDVPYAAAAPRLGAALGDPTWDAAARIDTLSPAIPADPDAPRPETWPVLSTHVRLAWRPDALYVRFVCEDPEPFAPHGQRRDAPHHEGDVVEVFIDGVGDARQWFEVQLSPAGGVMDQNTVLSGTPESDRRGLLTAQANREHWPNLSYDIRGLRSAVHPYDGGWVADVALPAAAVLRRREADAFTAGTTLRLNLIRYDRPLRPDADDQRDVRMGCWSPVVFGRPHRSPMRMGTVRLVAGGDD
ncbi:MAG: carbohydrate-binding family 9-like protein [Planctomycetota bacterium]